MSKMSLQRSAAVVALAGLTVLSAACSSASTTPAPTTSTRTSSSAPAAAPATPAAAATAPASAAAAPATSSTTTPAPSSAAADRDAVKLTLDPSASSATYRAREQLAGRSLPSDAIGKTSGVNGSLVLTADGALVADQSQITVDLTRLQSDESRRDNFVRSNTLQTNRYPQAVFVARQLQGLPAPLPTSGQATFQLLGDLTVHGVTKPVTWNVTAQFADAGVSGNATTNVNITDFGMSPPRVGPVLSIEDGLVLELAFSAARDA